MAGRLLEIWTSPAAGKPMESREEVRAVAGKGLEGDRYFSGAGSWSSGDPAEREMTLIESEQLGWFEENTGQVLASSECRRNLITKGIALNELVGVRFHVGEVEVEGLRLCEPCSYLQEKTGLDVLPAMVGRAGLNCRIVTEGMIRPGDMVG